MEFRPRRGKYRSLSSGGSITVRTLERPPPHPIESEIRVYPNLLTERKHVAAIVLNRGTYGMHAQRQIGKGRDFEKLREYIPGDGYDEIHWKATAKRGKPVTKVFQIERTQEIYVIVDSSRLTSREVAIPSTDGTTTTLERFITASLILGLAAERQGDLFGLVTFSNQADSFVRAKNGEAHYAHCRDALYLEPKLVSPDFEEMAVFFYAPGRRALLVFLTELDDPVLAEHHQVDGSAQSPASDSGQHPAVAQGGPYQIRTSRRWTRSTNTSAGISVGELRELDKKLRQRGVTFSTQSRTHERTAGHPVSERETETAHLSVARHDHRPGKLHRDRASLLGRT